MIKNALFIFLFCFLLLNAVGVKAAESLYDSALNDWLNGNRDSAKQKFTEITHGDNYNADEKNKAFNDLLILLAEEGGNKEALSYLDDTKGLPLNGYFSFFEKGWNLLSAGKADEAINAFNKSMALTASLSLTNQARFAISLAQARLKQTDNALENTVAVYTRYPYLLTLSSQMIGHYMNLKKDYNKAEFFTGSALKYDNKNFQAEIELAEINEKNKVYTQAWQAYYTLSEMDHGEKYFKDKVKKLSKKIKGDQEDMMYWTRMDWPVHTKPLELTGGKQIKIGLYASNKGVPSELSEFSFMANSDFEITDDKLGLLMSGKKFTPWKIIYDFKNNIAEIHDSLGSAARSTLNSFTISSKSEGNVILIKDPQFKNGVEGINRGDKEVGGNLRIIVSAGGFKLVNITDVETLVSPITAGITFRSAYSEFVKAASVLIRTKLNHMLSDHKHVGDYDFCDSSHCIEYAGLQNENVYSTNASSATFGITLTSGTDEKVNSQYFAFSRSCGGTNIHCIDGDLSGVKEITPFSIYSESVNSPAEDLMCIPEGRLDYVELNWTLLLYPKWIESRINRIKNIGKLKSILTMKRDNRGRVLSMRAVGTKGNADFEGEKAISNILAAGNLRSSLFTIRPINKGSYPEYFIVRGQGTDYGDGMCLRGAEGYASKKELDYKAILKKYFPDYHTTGDAVNTNK